MSGRVRYMAWASFLIRQPYRAYLEINLPTLLGAGDFIRIYPAGKSGFNRNCYVHQGKLVGVHVAGCWAEAIVLKYHRPRCRRARRRAGRIFRRVILYVAYVGPGGFAPISARRRLRRDFLPHADRGLLGE